MKKLLFSLGLLFFVFSGMTAQGKYTYFENQYSHFNGEFNELRYIDVDSISYVYYSDELFTTPVYIVQAPVEELSGFVPTRVKHTLINKSYDGLTDLLKTYDTEYPDQYYEHVKKYSPNGNVIYVE